MRLNCNVIVQNWSSSQSVGGQRRPARASISIGRKPCTSLNNNQKCEQETAFLLLCTSKNMSGTKYKISENVVHIYAKFVVNGKATIRFKEPPHDLCLSKADPGNLRKLLSILKLKSNELKKLKLSTLTPAKSSEVEKPKQELMICKRSDYPKSSSFPPGLIKLEIVNCGMVRIDIRILKLQGLESLNLSKNKIKEINVDLGSLKLLKALDFSSNVLLKLPSAFCRSMSLTSLDLSKNKLTSLPISFATTLSLVCVKLDHNQLGAIPCNIGQLVNLRILSVSNNQIRALPYSLGRLRLDSLDISENPLMETDSWFNVINLSTPLLQEFAGRAIKKSRICYNAHMIGRHLCDYLDSAKKCLRCSGACFSCIVYHLAKTDVRTVAQTVVTTYGVFLVPVELYFCSQVCYKSWQNALRCR